MTLSVDIKKQLRGFALETAFSVDGQTLGLLGGSGSGKSMTLRCIAGVVRPDEGRITCGNQVWFDSAARINLPPQQRRVGYLFQHYALFPHMTVAQNIACGLRGKRRVDMQTVHAWLSRFYLDGLAGRFPAQLSGGQQQRVALVRLLVSEPSVLLLDEPFSALDTYLRGEMEREIAGLLADFAGPALVVSHNRDEIYHLCDQIAVYHHGGLDTLGEKHAVFDRPSTRTAARLTGCRNVLDARPIDAHTLAVNGWQTCLHTAWPVQQATAVGVRAHHITLASKEDENQLVCTVESMVESPFEIVLYLRPQGGEALLCWKTDRRTYASVAGRDEVTLAIAPTAVLPLQEGERRG